MQDYAVLESADMKTWINHASAVEFNGQWYFFYHRGDVIEGSRYIRSACYEKMRILPL